jgi:hypothetical protein
VFVNGERISIVHIEAIAGANPHKTPAVLQNAHDMILRQARIDIEMPELQVLPLGETRKGNNQQQQAA